MKEIALWSCPVGIGRTFDDLFQDRNAKHFYYTVTDELKKNPSKCLIIWGTYANAFSLNESLKKEIGISAQACVVNERYMSMSINQIGETFDLPFVSFEKWMDTHEQVDIVIDFSYYRRELIEGVEDKVSRVFIGDMMGTLVLDKKYIITNQMMLDHLDQLKAVYNLWADEQSRREYIDFILQKRYGFYNKLHHDVQYFDKSVIKLSNEESYVDGGAYDGDTMLDFVSRVDNYQRIVAIEMDAQNFSKLKDKCNGLRNVELYNVGIAEKKGTIYASVERNSASYISGDDDGVQICVDSLDHMIQVPVSFIKLDIEGYEADAIRGGRSLICKYHPKLAVCMYHKFEDLWEIPLLIHQLDSNYVLYFRNYHNSATESVLYAI